MRALMCALMLCLAGTAAAQPTPPRMHLVEDLRIAGAKMGFDERPLSFLLVTPRGRIAYVDPYKFRVNFFDAAGNHIGDFGGKGDGNGQFGVSHGHEGDRADLSGGTVGDSIWLFDRSSVGIGRERATYLSSKGDFLGTLDAIGPRSAVPRSADAQRPDLYMMAAYADGGLLWEEVFAPSWKSSENADGSATWSSRLDSTVFVRVPKTNESERRITRFKGDPGAVTVGEVTLRAPFVEAPVVTVAPDGNRIVVLSTRATSSSGGVFVLTAISARGDTLFTRQYSFTGTPVDARHADNLVTQLVHDYVDLNGAHVFDKRTADELTRKLRAAVPQSRSPIRRAFIGLDNSLWMPLARSAGVNTWLVLDERGEPFATVSTPANFALAQMTKSNVWGIERPRDGRPSVVRYRVVPGAQ